MIRIKWYITGLIIIYFFSVNAQNTSVDDMNRYWNYRDRMNEYFVKVGLNEGESCIVSRRNVSAQGNGPELHYGDHIIFFGWYLGVLATEYKLLELNGEDTKDVIYELYCALEAYKRLDMCEDKPPWNDSIARFDGFFMRDDVPKTFLEKKKNKTYFNKSLSELPKKSKLPGQPHYVSKTVSDNGRHWTSQDQVIHLLLGISLVAKCSEDKSIPIYDMLGNYICDCNFKQTASIITDKVVGHLRYKGWWVSKDPNKKAYTGNNAIAFSWGFTKAASKITGNSTWKYFKLNTPISVRKSLWNMLGYDIAAPFPEKSFNPQDARHMMTTLAALGDSWRVSIVPFIVSLNLPINRTAAGIKWNSKQDDWETFYLLLWKFLHDKKKKIDNQKIVDQISSAPDSGPYKYSETDFSPNGWGSPRRYLCDKNKQYGGGWPTGNFNGTDYMLLYNLYRLVEEPNGFKRIAE